METIFSSKWYGLLGFGEWRRGEKSISVRRDLFKWFIALNIVVVVVRCRWNDDAKTSIQKRYEHEQFCYIIIKL